MRQLPLLLQTDDGTVVRIKFTDGREYRRRIGDEWAWKVLVLRFFIGPASVSKRAACLIAMAGAIRVQTGCSWAMVGVWAAEREAVSDGYTET